MSHIDQTKPESDLPKIGQPALRALSNAGIYRLEQFTKITEADLLKLHGVGPKAVRILIEVLKEKGLSFAKQG
ncbi:DNA-binding protein [Paenibacillus paridis]|uniref:DNA-binding protein n=1 Tax=Paenibacillus paridis TaxID=2583376 RepID=UPI00112330AD|nr:DNA-binding protein [Paenibacillus paridis]